MVYTKKTGLVCIKHRLVDAWVLQSWFSHRSALRCNGVLKRHYIEGSLEVKLPTIWTNGKEDVRRVRGEETGRGEKIREEKEPGERRKKVCEKVDKSQRTVVFQMCGGSGGWSGER